jgi:hypothetical protein
MDVRIDMLSAVLGNAGQKGVGVTFGTGRRTNCHFRRVRCEGRARWLHVWAS